MADFTFSNLTSVASGFSTTQLIANTNTDVIPTVHSGTSRSQSTAKNAVNHLISDMAGGAGGSHSADGGFLTGRRPHEGLLYPRGYYNK
jgi:hypothetical protein